MKQLLKFTGLLLLTLFFQACAGLHVFNTVQSPDLGAKGEGKITAYTGLDHAELQGAYALCKHYAIMANTYSSWATNTNESNSGGTMFGEAAFGRFQCIKKDTVKNRAWYYDVYAGGGWGQRKYLGTSQVFTLAESDEWSLFSDYEKTFLQASVFRRTKNWIASFTLQGAWFYYNTFNYKLIYAQNGYYSGAQTDFRDHSFFDINGAFTLKRQIHRIALVLQLAANLPFINALPVHPEATNSYFEPTPFNSRPIGINFGLQYSFKTRK